MSKTFSIRLDEDLLEEIKKQADLDKRNVNAQILVLIDEGIKLWERKHAAAVAAEDAMLSLANQDLAGGIRDEKLA